MEPGTDCIVSANIAGVFFKGHFVLPIRLLDYPVVYDRKKNSVIVYPVWPLLKFSSEDPKEKQTIPRPVRRLR